jgi:hypothetical protein
MRSGPWPFLVAAGLCGFSLLGSGNALAAPRLLEEPTAIERFLEELDGTPPDWDVVLGGGHGALAEERAERLFALNRARDRQRAGRPALSQRVTFLWSGVISAYDAESGSFRVAIGPKHIPTRWGLVRFKPENLPSEFIAVPSPRQAGRLAARLACGDIIEFDVAMTGQLVPEESIIYDHGHEDPGQGMIMPVVWVEAIEYRLPP